MGATTKPNELHGTWILTRWDYMVDGEMRGFPMGEDAAGQIIYGPDGHMSAILMQRDRPRSAATQFHQGTVEERERAALGYVSYGGRWDLVDDVVTHQVAYALFPNWVGTDLVREVSWQGDQLVLTALPETSTSGKVVVNRLFWARPPVATARPGRPRPTSGRSTTVGVVQRPESGPGPASGRP